jgi:N-carbamoyl-L-amino-acid hydrolase
MTVADHVSRDRLRADIQANAEFGAVDAADGRGRTVLAGTDANRAARDRLVDRLRAADLDVRIDAVGNVAGRWTPEGADPDAAPVASGSHLDSVPRGGIFDGPLGVYAALEAVRAMQEDGVDPPRPVEVVCFTEEEGTRFADGVLGSAVAAGDRSVDAALAHESAGEMVEDGEETLEAALDRIGYRGERRLDASAWDAWVELHVEQHTALEAAGVPVGVVTDITGITHCEAVVEGEANHAGSTPMDARTDALAAASEFVLDVERAARDRTDRDPSAVGTVGSQTVEPNATNVVPGRVDLGVDVRSVEYKSMAAIVDAARDSQARLEAERNVRTGLVRGFDLEPSRMSERVQAAAERAGERAGIGTMRLHSGAFHDSANVASVTDAGMLFAPSRDGVSHSPREWTDWADCAAATRALAETLVELAGE